MRLLCLVPSNIHKRTAGSRIRYDRLGASGRGDFEIVVQSLEDLRAGDLAACDVCIFSKTYCVEAIAMARQLREQGKLVGVDLFDDLFSQTSDSRLYRFRVWLRGISEVCHFGLCSTRVMHDLARHYAPNLPVHMVPDPFPEIDPSALAATVAEKLNRAVADRRIDVVWFGNGSNPFFPVGLHDLTSFSWSLAELAAGRFDIRLKIVTDQASATPAALARLARLPVAYRLENWSVEAEQEALRHALVCFIPVNGQSFSRAKSFNRALTAISAGTQVLSPGFPLYRDLQSAIYSDARELLDDIDRGTCRIRPATIPEVTRIAAAQSELGEVADKLFAFLSQQFPATGEPQQSASQRRRESNEQALLYGCEQTGVNYRAALAAGIMTIGTPYSPERAYKVQLRREKDGRLELWLAAELVSSLDPTLRAKCSKPAKKGKLTMVKLDALPSALQRKRLVGSYVDHRAIVQETRAYRDFLVDFGYFCRELFPNLNIFIADTQYTMATSP